MKKILSLLLVSSSIFSMQLQVVKPSKFHAQYKSSDISKAAFARAITSHTSQFTIPDKPITTNEVAVKKILIQPSSVHVPHNLQGLELYYSKDGFVALHKDKKHVIDSCLVDKTARNMTKEQLKSFLKMGYFAINQSNDGSLSLKANQRLAGGGPVFGTFMYWLTKSLCYGTALTAVGAAVVTTGGVAVGAATGGLSAAGGIIVGTAAATTTTTAAIGTTAGVLVGGATAASAVTGGATIVAGSIATASAAGATVAGVTVVQAAALTTAAGVTAAASTTTAASVGTGAACVIGIETLSTAIGTFFGMLPTP